jgi:hypothetical protein
VPTQLTLDYRARRCSQYVLSIDVDEYLQFDAPFYHRQCDNALYCPSPLRDWLEDGRTGYGSILFQVDNVIEDEPADKEELQEIWPPDEHWRYTGVMGDQQAARQICPFEAETEEQRERIAQFRLQDSMHALRPAHAHALASTSADLVCDLPYAVRHVSVFTYPSPLAGLFHWPKTLWRSGGLLVGDTHFALSRRSSLLLSHEPGREEEYDPAAGADPKWTRMADQMSVLHFRMIHGSRTPDHIQGKSPAELKQQRVELFAPDSPLRLRKARVAHVMQWIPLPPRTDWRRVIEGESPV